ncbi:hypothetical protein PICST_69023 [Scheffersomyces stipitis CBS 6054]|uniref:Dienelactone hydrolase domain-containing protein n=1 Tax=Scheffersomyces stipitis (strain ATCC 58785 / CBS 6054 / NBRC 10063 / NRRL Y-11545) TaxID=322104 RepID=A3GGL9_PICST|nr:predicted protein [Scheffersomyces stipitis CBS 6054]EAZ63547.1 hypothetical protein PICST_69023 [Scheffersomyces stipitis CBS 6054]KAG2735498.1 hypothetical protein G9P44_001712 [Scheffersomyces stipitis]
MASNPPGECCRTRNFHEGTPIGTHKTILGLNTYQVGAEYGNDRIIVILVDVHGNKFNNTLLLADELSKAKYQVLIPDILSNDPVDGQDFATWLPKHGPEITAPIVDAFLKAVNDELKPKFLAGIGYCFGAKYVIQNLSSKGHLSAGAVAHPSFVTIEEVSAIKKPILISAAETDSIFTVELRHQSEAELIKIGARYQLDLFSGVEHGYSVRGDISNPVVKYAKEKTLDDQVRWFNQF